MPVLACSLHLAPTRSNGCAAGRSRRERGSVRCRGFGVARRRIDCQTRAVTDTRKLACLAILLAASAAGCASRPPHNPVAERAAAGPGTMRRADVWTLSLNLGKLNHD